MKLMLTIAITALLALFLTYALLKKYANEEFSQIVEEVDKYLPIKKSVENSIDDAKTFVGATSLRTSGAKHDAWKKWYVKPAHCRKLELGNDLVECTDHRIRARQKFEELWLNNEL